MSTEAPTRRTKSLLFEPNTDMLLPRDATNLPDPIAEANERAWEKYEAWQSAHHRAGEAGAVAKAAPRHDEHALEAAIAADEKPPKQTTPAKREKAEAARREADAIEKVAKQAILALYDVVAEHKADFLAGREAAYEAVSNRPRELLDELAASWAAVETEADLLAIARRWHNNVRSAALSSNRRTSHDRIARAERELAGHRQHRTSTEVPDSFEHLLVALRHQIEERA